MTDETEIIQSYMDRGSKTIRRLFNKIGFQIALAVTLMCLILFGILYIAVVNKSQESFISVVQTLPLEPRGSIRVFEYPGLPYDILHFDFQGAPRPKPLNEVFTSNLQSSLLWVSVLALGLSILMGFVTSKIVNAPLGQLRRGMDRLRKNDYQTSLGMTGTLEFDEVIEEFNRLSGELARVETLRKDLISDTSHELKTPLTSLLTQLEAVRDGIFTMDERRAKLLIDQVVRLNDVVDRLQEFSRLRSRGYMLQREDFLLHDQVSDISESEKKNLEKSGIELVNKIPFDFSINADKTLIGQVFANLINNSVRYSKGKKITFSTELGKVIVADDGIGVDEEHLPYIFERFYRVEKSRNRKTGGLGLGLAIVQEIIEAHGWKISARSADGLIIEINTKPK